MDGSAIWCGMTLTPLKTRRDSNISSEEAQAPRRLADDLIVCTPGSESRNVFQHAFPSPGCHACQRRRVRLWPIDNAAAGPTPDRWDSTPGRKEPTGDRGCRQARGPV